MKALAPDDPRVIGEYRLRGRLGAGGMGRVYLGLSPAGRAVANKVVHADLASDAAFLRRFGQRTNYLRFHMARLRRKLEDDPSRPRHLLTEPGMGYRYQP